MSPRPVRRSPSELTPGWPDAHSDDPVAEVARLLCLNVRATLDGRSVRELARLTGVDRATIGTILAGKAWPDLQTVARLEIALGRPLWPPFGGNSAAEHDLGAKMG